MSRWLAALCVVLCSYSSRAGQCTEAHDVTKAQVTPCAGVLMPDAWADECVRHRVSLIPRLRLRIAEIEERARIDAQAAAEVMEACSIECARLRDQLVKATAPPPAGPDPMIVGLVSALGAALAVGAVWIAVEATR